MKITLLQIGRTTPTWLQEGCEEYAVRIQRYLSFQIHTIPDLRNTKNMPVSVVLGKEAEVLMGQIQSGDTVVLLDTRGKTMTTQEFSCFIQSRMTAGIRHLMFVIAGAHGASPELKSRANYLLSLSPLTFPHQLVRVLFLEQLYRGLSILRNEPYHNE